MGAGYSHELGEDCLAERLSEGLNETMQRMRSRDPDLMDIDLSNCGIAEDGLDIGLDALSSNDILTSIDLSYNALGTAAAVRLMEVLSQEQTCGMLSLRMLRLSGNNIGAAGGAAIGQFLALNPPLQELYLYNCGLTDESVLVIANALQRNTTLRILNLDCNPLTNRSLIMLAQALATNDTLCDMKLPLDQPTIRFNPDRLAEVRDYLQVNTEKHHRLQAVERTKASKRERLLLQAELQRQKNETAIAAEKAKVEEEIKKLEELKQSEDEEIQRMEQELQQKHQKRQKELGESAAKREKELQIRAEEQQKWRMKLTGNGTLVKEWRNGFTILKSAPGTVGEIPTETTDRPRRLKPCWCDPQDVSAPYAKTLHYHCKYEKIEPRLEDGATGAPRYEGCRCSGHICSTVGFYSKPLPDTSAAHFFASSHPMATPST